MIDQPTHDQQPEPFGDSCWRYRRAYIGKATDGRFCVATRSEPVDFKLGIPACAPTRGGREWFDSLDEACESIDWLIDQDPKNKSA